eukprot:6213585-Pleurochrysis_carterae.AAC.7
MSCKDIDPMGRSTASLQKQVLVSRANLQPIVANLLSTVTRSSPRAPRQLNMDNLPCEAYS